MSASPKTTHTPKNGRKTGQSSFPKEPFPGYADICDSAGKEMI